MAENDQERHGDLDPSIWDEQKAVTGRPGDPSPANSTFAGRKKAGRKAVPPAEAENKAVQPDDADDKAVRPARTRVKG